MMTTQWQHNGSGGTDWWTAALPVGLLRLYGPDATRLGHSFNWAHLTAAGINEGGHTRASLRAYCKREGITLPELPVEWCPEPAWGEWVTEGDTGARVSVRTDGGECVALCSDGSWGHTRGTDPWRVSAVIRTSGFKDTHRGLPAARAYRAYAAEHGLPQPPADWCPEPVEEPAKPYSLADDPRLREVVRTKWGEARWYEGNSNNGMHLAVDHEEGFGLASVYPDGRWIAYSGPTSADEIQRASKATNPANAYTECMVVLRDLGSLVDEKPDPDACAPPPPSIQERLLNLATRMWLSDRPASYYAGELRDLARELDGGDQ